MLCPCSAPCRVQTLLEVSVAWVRVCIAGSSGGDHDPWGWGWDAIAWSVCVPASGCRGGVKSVSPTSWGAGHPQEPQFAWDSFPPSPPPFPRDFSFAKVHQPLAVLPTINNTGHSIFPQVGKPRLKNQRKLHSQQQRQWLFPFLLRVVNKRARCQTSPLVPSPTKATQELKALFSCLEAELQGKAPRRPVGTLFLGPLWEAVPSNPATETGLTSLRVKVVAAESRTSMGMGPSVPQSLPTALTPFPQVPGASTRPHVVWQGW